MAEGYCADLVVFNPDTVASEPIVERADLPGDCERLYAGAVGVEHVLVNGTEIITSGHPTGATPGTLPPLRPRHRDCLAVGELEEQQMPDVADGLADSRR